MIKKKLNYKLVPMWSEIKNIVKRPNYQGDKLRTSDDFILYRKIINFLYLGATGTLFEIKETQGLDKLYDFFDYILYFINSASTPGHYYPSGSVKQQIKDINDTTDLFDLDASLNRISRVEHAKHGDQNSKGWRSKNMKMSERKELLNKKQLAKVMNMSPSTLWRLLKNNNAKAEKLRLKKCPAHRDYSGGRVYYLANEVQDWLNQIAKF